MTIFRASSDAIYKFGDGDMPAAKMKKVRTKMLAKTGGTLATAGTSNDANIDFGGVPVMIVGVNGDFRPAMDADAETAEIQVSTRASLGTSTDDRGVLMHISAIAQMTTSGVFMNAFQQSWMLGSGLGIQVAEDEKVFIHTKGTTGMNYNARFTIFYVVP